MSTNSAYGTLYLIPCPIAEGDPANILPPCNHEVVDTLDYFIVENVRSARRFLSSYGVSRPISELEFVELNEHTRDEREVERMIAPLLSGRSAGVISEAGCPSVADPGQMAVRLCHRKGIRVVPLVGPSSIILSVMASGLSGQSFAFNGYIPVKEPERTKAVRRLESRARAEHQSQLFIEAPYRNLKTLEYLIGILCPDTTLAVAVSVTSSEERIMSHTVAEWRKTPLPEINRQPTVFVIGYD